MGVRHLAITSQHRILVIKSHQTSLFKLIIINLLLKSCFVSLFITKNVKFIILPITVMSYQTSLVQPPYLGFQNST